MTQNEAQKSISKRNCEFSIRTRTRPREAIRFERITCPSAIPQCTQYWKSFGPHCIRFWAIRMYNTLFSLSWEQQKSEASYASYCKNSKHFHWLAELRTHFRCLAEHSINMHTSCILRIRAFQTGKAPDNCGRHTVAILPSNLSSLWATKEFGRSKITIT